VPIVPRLWSDPGWLLALTERSGLLFVRRDAFPAGAQPRQKDEAWAQVLKEATEQARTYGRAAPAAERSRGLALLKLGDFQGAAAALAVYTAAVPDDPEAGEVLSVLRAAERGDAAARQIVEQLWAGGRTQPAAGTGR
jgi:hypothetical protein